MSTTATQLSTSNAFVTSLFTNHSTTSKSSFLSKLLLTNIIAVEQVFIKYSTMISSTIHDEVNYSQTSTAIESSSTVISEFNNNNLMTQNTEVCHH